MQLDVVTLFPEWFEWFRTQRHVRNVVESGSTLQCINPRDFTTLSGRQVDDTPFGGGAGMVMRPDVLDAALASMADARPAIYLTPRGRKLTQARVRSLAAGPGAEHEERDRREEERPEDAEQPVEGRAHHHLQVELEPASEDARDAKRGARARRRLALSHPRRPVPR